MTDTVKKTIEQLERISNSLASIGETVDYTNIAIQALEQQPCEDCISREQAVYVASGYCAPQNIADELRKLPSVKPQPFINKPCISEGVCREDKIQVLDKIRAEIVELTKCPYGTECLGANCPSNTDCMICGDHVLEILDKYKAESEE